jgi:HSP20 family protein
MRHENPEKPSEKVRIARENPSVPSAGRLAYPPSAASYGFEPLAAMSEFDRYFDNMRRNMESMLLPVWSNIGVRPAAPPSSVELARADFADQGDAFVVNVELPGFTRDDVEIELSPQRIEIQATRKSEHAKEDPATGFFAHERTYRSLQRTFEFPEPVVAEKAEAELKDGVLFVRTPKQTPTPAAKPLRVKVK